MLILAACSDTPGAEQPAPAPPTETASGTYHVEVEIGERTYDVYAPQMHDLQPLAPAVIAFHGQPGSPDTIRRESGLETLADEIGFLAVFPRGEDQRWKPESSGPDVEYVEALIGELVDTWGADPDRIYVTGFSNGADMAIVSSLVLSDRVAAAAPVAPSGTGSVREVIEEYAAPVPVVAFIGETDGRAELGLEMLEAWRSGQSCDNAALDEETVGLTTTNWTCAGHPFRVHVVADQGHVWFGNPDDREPLWASETMWEFFSEVG
ncbi:MAG TPA: PHB depolymerase family esterase [Jiangellaceae bacterium]